MTTIALLSALALSFQSSAVPTPRETPVQVVISGRSSILKSIVVKNVGQNLPATYAKDKIKNASGFNWYVSYHFALQTDYPEAKAKELLTLLELTYPHYVEIFGREPANIGQLRMAVVYGSSTDTLKTALAAVGIGWNFQGGGITYEGFNIAYNYPSGSLQYHQRYIMLHEGTHLFQMCLNGTTRTTPGWYYEGIADALGHHVWEEAKQKLTLNIVDKPTVNNWYDAGLERYAKEPFKASEILSEKKGGRELGFLLVHYFDTDLDRLMRFQIWRDELFRLAKYDKYQADSAKLIEELFGSEQLDKDFDGWLQQRKSTFHYVDWGWEQDGDTMISYGWPQTGTYSQTDLLVRPKDKPMVEPLRMDYPRHPQSPLVDRVQRGIAEPVVGCLVGFRLNPDAGVAGMALGVEGRSFVKVLVEQRKRLTIDGSDLGAAKRTIDMPDAFIQATAKSYQIGLTIKIAKDALLVTAQANDGGTLQTCRLSIPLSETQRERLLNRPMAVLSRDGRHEVAPYIDDLRKPEPDWGSSTPPNRWRSLLMAPLYKLYRAEWRLGKDVPSSLASLKKQLLEKAVLPRSEQETALATYKQQIEKIVADVKASKAPADKVKEALDELKP